MRRRRPGPTSPPTSQAIRAVSMRWLELERAGDASGSASLFAAGTLYRAAVEPVVGNAAIDAYLGADFAGHPGQVVVWSTDRVEIAPGGDLAAEYGSWTEASTAATGTTEDHGRYVTTFRKVAVGWKIVAAT